MSRKVMISFFVVVIIGLGIGQAQDQPSSAVPAKPPRDESKYLPLLHAFEAGTGWDSGALHKPTAQAGIKLGLDTLTLDLQFDRSSQKSAFTTEGSVMLPLFRYPGPSSDENRNFLRVYAEPGLGYRNNGDFGGYASAKVMFVLFSDGRLYHDKPSPFIEIQRRFPFNAPLRGDNRVSFGLIWAFCRDCGVE